MSPYALIDAEKARHSVVMMCRTLEVSRSGYYAWACGDVSTRARDDTMLKSRIKQVHTRSRGTYGSPRIVDVLKRQGVEVGRRRIARLMREEGITGTPIKEFRRTTDSTHAHRVAPNHLNRQFNPQAPNRVWATDISYVRTWEGWLYVAVVIDLFSRKVVGWSMQTHMKKTLVLDALSMALSRRTPQGELLLVVLSARSCPPLGEISPLPGLPS